MNNSREFYNQFTKEELITIIRNQNLEIHLMERKLTNLTGCSKFGSHDGMDGGCIDCHIFNTQQFIKCEQFAKRK